MARNTTIGVDPFDPGRGAGFEAVEDGSPTVECTIIEDGGEFRTHRPPPVERPRRLCFVDGVMRTEARLTRTNAGGETNVGLAGGWAAGAVLAASPEPARIDHVASGRAAIFTGGHTVRLPGQPNGWEWVPYSVERDEIDAARQQLQRLMRDAEAAIAERLCAEGWLTVFDGPLHSIRRSRGVPVVGYVKTHHRRTLAPDQWVQVPRLVPGERCSLFAMGDDLYASYLRIGDPGPWTGPWAGIVRVEVPAGPGRKAAAAAVNDAASWLPEFASALHRDPRAPVNLTPVSGLEQRLHHLLGDPRLALRAVREAVLQLEREGRAA